MHAMIEVGGALYDEGRKLLQDDEGEFDEKRATNWFGRITEWLWWSGLVPASEFLGNVVLGPVKWILERTVGANIVSYYGIRFLALPIGMLILGFVLGVLTSEVVRRLWAAMVA